MTRLLSYLLISFSVLHGQNTISSTDRLKDLYIKSTKGPDSLTFQREFFEAFPSTFKDFNNTYGYFDNADPHLTYAGALYPEASDHVSLLFRLTTIPENDLYSKIIRISIGGHWEADAINYFQNGLREKVFKNPALTSNLLKSQSDKNIKSFWYFFYCGIHPTYRKVPDELTSIETFDKRVYGLMRNGLNQAIEKIGH